jgi:ADP-glucose pyrophosphorylase
MKEIIQTLDMYFTDLAFRNGDYAKNYNYKDSYIWFWKSIGEIKDLYKNHQDLIEENRKLKETVKNLSQLI